MKTKEELRDIKLFADFIGDDLKEWYGYDVDTKQQIVINYFTEFSRFYNPQDDWNLLMKAYEKIYKIKINSKAPEKIYITFLSIWQGILDSLFESNKEKIYECILEFIKFYSKINTNTNNNQS